MNRNVDVFTELIGLRRAVGHGRGIGCRQARAVKRLRQAVFEWLAIDLSADGHDPTHGLQGEIAGTVLCIRAGLTEICDRGHDKGWVPLKQLINAIPPALNSAWFKAFDHDIALFDQLLHDRTTRC